VPASFDSDTYRDVLLFLITAAVIVPLFRQLKMSPVLGFLIAGVALGPFGLGAVAAKVSWLSFLTISQHEQIERVGELGVVFLLFTIGLELSWERLARMRRLIFGLGALQVVLSAAALGGIGYALGQSASAAATIGSALALSSTAIVIPVLAERKRLHSSGGRTAFAVLLFQDLAVAPLLIMVAMLSAADASGLAPLYALLPAVLALAAVVGLGRLLVRPLFRHVAATGNPELFMAACLLVIIGTGLVTAATGQSMALGAFIAGLLLAETEYRREVEVLIEPFKGLLLGLFFVSVGAGLDFSEAADRPGTVAAMIGGLLAIKACVILLVCAALGLPRTVARETALLLAPGGEFAFVLIGAAVTAGIMPAPVATTAAVAVTLSMFAIPGLARLAERLGRRHAEHADTAGAVPIPEDGTGRVLIIGYGRVGQLVGEMLARHGVRYLAVDREPALVARERDAGRSIYYGDATRPDFLRRCGIDAALALVVTMDSPSAIEHVVRAGRTVRPDIAIIARARDAEHATKLYRLGVSDAVPETVEASLQLSEAVLVDIGVPAGPVIASIHERREEFRKLLQRPDATGRVGGPIRTARRLRDHARMRRDANE
jgi:monovalent cation:H+ antiporter-2, CPA2 family